LMLRWAREHRHAHATTSTRPLVVKQHSFKFSLGNETYVNWCNTKYRINYVHS
jgi:hypothetical protein